MFLLANMFTIAAMAQTTISGNVRNSATKEGAGAVSVTVKGGTAGTFTDDKGNFKLSVKSLPVTLLISSVGYELQEVTVNSAEMLQVEFKPTNVLGTEVVVSANRVPQRILESPVSIERVSAANIRNSPISNFYDVVASLKGVDITTSSLTFKTPTTRGFNSSGNTRFNQLVDGMDNLAPGLNFSVGAIIGLSELDVDNIELLSGASSALYGPGGMNGTLLMTSKNPFKYQGLSFLVKEGIMNTDKKQRGESNAYHNWNLRWGKKTSEKFAFKINAELIQSRDWAGVDYRNYARTGTTGKVIAGDRTSDPNYDGINTYGDETTIDIMRNVLMPIAKQAPFLAPYVYLLDTTKQINVSRTGYTEKETINPNTVNFKLGGSLHYKLNTFTEAVLAAYWGTGNTVYTGSERYSLKDFKMGQYKFEVNSRYWNVRAYTTQENAGESYNATVTTRLFNESWKASPQWYQEYSFAFLNTLLVGGNLDSAHRIARASADVGRPLANSSQFRTKYDEIRKKPIKDGGGLLLDKSDLYALEGSFNMSHLTKKFADILIGGNYKQFVLNSQGTLFADSAGVIKISEYGAFIQASRQIIDRLKLTVSGRYDKNENFDGRFTPRATALIKIAEGNNIRLSYQTAYRFPSNQQQFINLAIGANARLLGSNKSFITFFNMVNNPVYTLESVQTNTAQKFDVGSYAVKPESVSSFEAGYKGLLMQGKILVDVYGYYGQYQDFLGRQLVVQSKVGTTPVATDINNAARSQVYSLPVNTTDKVKTSGFGLSVDARLPWNFTVGGNVSTDRLTDVPSNFVAYFNAPEWKTNLSLANTGFGPKKRWGASVNYRWQKSLYYQGDFANGQLPDVHTLDAQISLRLPKNKSILKFGANNLLNQYYYNAVGNSQIGGLYYVSFGYNVY
jgi:outer membrane receptor protein involved in Fe transport